MKSDAILLVFVCILLRYGLSEGLCKVLTSERVATVVSDQVVQAVKHFLFYQVVPGLPILLLGTYTAMIHRGV